MENENFIPLDFQEKSALEILETAQSFYNNINKRRSVRFFSDKAVDYKVIENIVAAAGTAPSGAHKQPWSFCVVENPELKSKIRVAAEEEEFKSYNGRMSEEWLEDLAAFGTDWKKPFLEIAPYLIVVFKKPYDLEDEKKRQNYYVNESVGIACGMLISAIHLAGLVTLTHTPSPMNFLANLLERPKNERAYLLLPVGYPAQDAVVPDLERKKLEEILFRY